MERKMTDLDRAGIVLMLFGLFIFIGVPLQTIPISGFMIGLGSAFLMWNVWPWNKYNG
jgi:UDP-N-acetylmuramyl pentapeptide phosphotransferase/UDP-N-acetylglucosamine-1-phosphate transferase